MKGCSVRQEEREEIYDGTDPRKGKSFLRDRNRGMGKSGREELESRPQKGNMDLKRTAKRTS